MIDPHALRTLIEQWRERETQFRRESDVHPESARRIYCDGKAMALSACATDLEALLSALPETPGALDRCRGALADIAHSPDMTLAVARKKAKRVYKETAEIVNENGTHPPSGDER